MRELSALSRKEGKMKSHASFQTEIEFELPKGYVDEAGQLHRKGIMRLATAADEILPLRDPRVQENEAYVSVIVLARVIVRLGSLKDINTGIIEGLYASDMAYMQRLYENFNSSEGEVGIGNLPAPNGNGLCRMTSLGEA
jgi:hypothetical protein